MITHKNPDKVYQRFLSQRSLIHVLFANNEEKRNEELAKNLLYYMDKMGEEEFYRQEEQYIMQEHGYMGRSAE